jgi:hypothetical protein
MTGQQGSCPQCGAPISFGGAHSLAAVCGYCRSAVVRKGAQIELLGKVPDLVSTSTQLQLGDAGRLDRRAFRIVGRLQLDQGAAAWDEWYVLFADGKDGWLAEAKGALFATRRFERAEALPRFEALAPGAHAQLSGLGRLAVDEVGAARFVSAEGELPFRPEVGASYRFADLSGGGGQFATIDYGGEGDAPELFEGRRIRYEDAELSAQIASRKRGAAAPVAGEAGRALTCPSCGAPVPLRRSESESVACASCRSLLDVSLGALAVVGKLGRRTEPLIPLGAKGTLQGLRVEVLGYLRRYTEYEGQRFEWSEWQLWSDEGYRWLSEYQGHFTWLEPIAAGEVRESASAMAVGEVRYRHFQTSRARYADLQGELSWQARATDVVKVRDYVAPPLALSCEEEKGEINWSRGNWLPAAEVWKGLSLPGAPPRPVGVGAVQPNPYEKQKRWATRTAVAGAVALVVLAAFLSSALPHERIASLDVPLPGEGVALSEPFELTSTRQSLQIAASAPMDQSWAGLDLALINDDSGEARTFGFELSHFEGRDDEGRWAEGSRSARAVLGNVPRGRYLLRVEVTLDPPSKARVPPTAHVEVVRGVFVYAPLLIALLALVPAPFWLRVRASDLERRRWAESDHPIGGDDEEDE